MALIAPLKIRRDRQRVEAARRYFPLDARAVPRTALRQWTTAFASDHPAAVGAIIVESA